MKNTWNIEVLFESAICFFFSAVLLYITYTGGYLQYVTPKMAPYLYFTGIVVAFWGLVRLRWVRKPRYRKRLLRSLVLLLPALLLVLPHDSLDSQSVSAALTNDLVTQNQTQAATTPAAEDTTPAQNTASDTAPSTEETTTPAAASASLPAGLDAEAKSITVPDAQFYPWLVELSTNTTAYLDYQVRIKGYVYRDATLQGTQFAVARLLMSCCAADLVPCGPLAVWSDAATLTADSWVYVQGTISQNEANELEIQVLSVEPAEKPDEEYVYMTY
ncbi:MAG: TIGR03943 family putative permease subunit [Lachnospiraceae bacterium]